MTNEPPNRQDADQQSVTATAPTQKVRRLEWIGLVAFVTFLVVTGSWQYGLAPITPIYGPFDSSFRPNIISLLGVVAFILSTLILLPRWSLVMKFSGMPRLLTLVAVLGLLGHTALALLHPLHNAATAVKTLDPQLHTERLLATGPEEWTTNGQTWHINSTCYVKLPEDEGYQYTIDTPYKFPADMNSFSQSDLMDVVRPIIMQAYMTGNYLRCIDLRHTEYTPARIAVGLVEKTGDHYRLSRGYMTIEQIKWRIAAEAPSVLGTPAVSASAPAQ